MSLWGSAFRLDFTKGHLQCKVYRALLPLAEANHGVGPADWHASSEGFSAQTVDNDLPYVSQTSLFSYYIGNCMQQRDGLRAIRPSRVNEVHVPSGGVNLKFVFYELVERASVFLVG